MIGLVDFTDVLHHMIAFGLRTSSVDSLATSWDSFRVLYLSDLSARNPLMRLTPESKASEALEVLFTGVHRIIIVDEENKRKVVNIICQSDVLRFLHHHSEMLPIAKQLRSIESLGLGTQASAGAKLHSVYPEVSARNAFTVMRLTHTHALPIVDRDGTLLSQISASDLKLVFDTDPANVSLLDIPSLEFAKLVRLKQNGGPLLISVESDDNCSSVISKMVKENVHRVFITNNLSQLLGVITVTDLALLVC